VLANDFLAQQVAKRPDRFQAFAALPLQSYSRQALPSFPEVIGFSPIGHLL
jgi:gamma-resorcylate decarboxylase